MVETFLGFEAVFLARIQFAFTIAFHFIFPAFTIGLSSYLAVLNALYLRTGNRAFHDLFNYWIKIFAICFAMGVVSGIVMAYQFGTNWSVFSDKVGAIIGPLMAYEVLTAFFLEAGFLGIMLFGRERVGPSLHMLACAMVAIGTAISATWILSVNSWMQTPQGFTIAENGQYLPEDWAKIIFNPSFATRLTHTLTATYLTTALVVGAVGAVHLLRRSQDNEPVRIMFKMAIGMIAVVAPLQIFVGHDQGLNTLEHQPTKVMAMEGHFESHPNGAPLILFGIPNPEEKRVDYKISIPYLSSLILKGDLHAPVDGLDTVADEFEPPLIIVFWSFRVMVGLGFLMAGLGIWGAFTMWSGKLNNATWLQRASLIMGPSGFVAVIAGWVTTEVGRQPYTVYGELLTADSVSPIAAPAVAASLIAFIVVYFFVFGAGTFYIMRLMNAPPKTGEGNMTVGSKGLVRAAGITPAPQLAAQRNKSKTQGAT